MTFAAPYWFAALSLLGVLFFLRKRGYLGFSDTRMLTKSPLWLRALAKIPVVFAATALILLVVALAQPQIPGKPIPRTIPGRDIEIIVDISFSMSFPFKGNLAQIEAPKELGFTVPFSEARRNEKGNKFVQPKEGFQRIHAAQSALLTFIDNRWRNKTGDRIGLIVFDSKPRYAWPITDDLRMLYRKTQFISTNLGNATNFGRIYPGPIDLATEHFNEYGQAKSRVLIMVTDGEDEIDGMTQQRLTKLLKDNNVRLYLIGIGETMAKNDVDIYKVAQSVGGQVFRVEDADSMKRCFETIDRLEKSEVTISQMETRDDIFFYFAWGALGFLVLFLLSEFVVLSR